MDNIRDRIEKATLKKTAAVYGEESTQYEEVKQKLGKIKILPFSALDALDGKMEHNAALIEKSGTKDFEAALTHMLTTERGALELSKPLNILQVSYLEIGKNIEARRNALELSTQEFEERQQKAVEKINQLRAQKKEEELRLKKRCEETKKVLLETASEYYGTLETTLSGIVESYQPASMEKFDTKEVQEPAIAELQEQIAKASKECVSDYSEKVIVELQDIISEEALQSAKFTTEILRSLNEIRTGADSDSFDVANLAATGIDVLTDFVGIYGIGGVVAGYRVAGLKGAVVGGGIGLAANLATAAILSGLAVSALPLFVISCFAGTFVSKKVTTFLFGDGKAKKALTNIKKSFQTNIRFSIEEMKKNREFETWVEGLVGSRFDEVIQKLNEECETVLKDTENTINGIRGEMAEYKANGEAAKRKLDEAKERCLEIIKDLEPVYEQVHAALKSMENEQGA